MTWDLNGKVVVITGGASGIGLAAAHEFARYNAKVVLLDKNETALNTAVKNAHGQITGQVCDISDRHQCDQVFDGIIRSIGQIDILFNNAGITQRGLFINTRPEVFEKVMAVNFFGALYCTKAALPSLIRQKGLIIVNESVAGVAPLLGRTGYGASKHALHGLFTSLRCELRHLGVHVTIACPGFVRTGLQETALGSDGKIAVHEQTRVGREMTPEAAARKIVTRALRRKDMVVLTGMGKLGYLLSRFFPGIYERIMTRRFKSELDICT